MFPAHPTQKRFKNKRGRVGFRVFSKLNSLRRRTHDRCQSLAASLRAECSAASTTQRCATQSAMETASRGFIVSRAHQAQRQHLQSAISRGFSLRRAEVSAEKTSLPSAARLLEVCGVCCVQRCRNFLPKVNLGVVRQGLHGLQRVSRGGSCVCCAALHALIRTAS